MIAGCPAELLPAGPKPTGGDRVSPTFSAFARGRALHQERVGSMNALTFRRVGFAVVVLSSCVAGDAWGQVQYTVTDLGTFPGGTYSHATGINDSGQVVGYVRHRPPTLHSLFFTATE